MSSLKAISTLQESQCDNFNTQSSDKLTRKEKTRRTDRILRSSSRSVERTTIEVIIDSDSDTESVHCLTSNHNNNWQSLSNRNSSSSYIESTHFPNKLDNDIHQRYIDYINLSQKDKDTTKTDYTYAHSFAYSAFVPLKEQFNWLVPNMSRQSLSSLSHRSKQDGQNATAESATTATNSISKSVSSYSRKSYRSGTSSSSSYVMAGSSALSATPLNGRTLSRTTQPEYSDDDEDYALSQPKVNARPRKPYRSAITTGAFEDEEDDEELTIIRRINRIITRTFRNYTSAHRAKHPSTTSSSSSSSSTIRSSLFQTESQSDSQSLINGILVPLSVFIVLVACCLGGYYSLPEGSFNSIRSSVDRAYQTTSSLLTFGPKTLIEYRNANQFMAEVERLRNEIHDLRLKSQERDSREQESAKSVSVVELPDFDSILLRLDEIERKVSTCCSQKPQAIDTIAMEANITSRLKEIVNHSLNISLSTFQNDFDRRFIAEMVNLQTKINEFAQKRMDEAKNELKNDMKSEVGNMNMGKKPEVAVSPELAFVEELIRKAILKYDADKTGEADFALESAGAWILSTRCSETYQLNSASYKIFGLTMWKSSSSPRVVIQPGVIPGECWCFRGAEGRLGIHLSANIVPTAFTYEHIPRSLSRDGHIQSAPQSFAVYGLKTDTDLEPELLGEYMFDIDGERILQRFSVQNVQMAAHGFNKVELVVKSNHGHPEYTCLYRFRVHGQLNVDSSITP